MLGCPLPSRNPRSLKYCVSPSLPAPPTSLTRLTNQTINMFIPIISLTLVYTCSNTLHICTLSLAIPTLYFLLLFPPSFCLFPGGVYLLCSFLPSLSLLPPHADYVISWFVDIPVVSKNMLRLYLIRSISVSHVTLRLTLPSASFSSCPRRCSVRLLSMRPDTLLNKWKVSIPLAVYY